jgi:enoyl-CoA hydratase
MLEYQDISYEQIGKVARIYHNRPQVRNAEGRRLLEELDHAMSRAASDASVNCIIIGAVGDHFSAGHDMKESIRDRPNFSVEERWAFEIEHFFDYSLRIRDVSKPTIAQVQGACIAAGFMVANMCDLVVASDDAYFSDPTGHTLGAAAVEILVHPWVLGVRKAKEFLFTGERISAHDALSFGMVNRVVARDALENETLKLAERIADAPPFGLSLIKRSINRMMDGQGFKTSLSAHFDTHQLSHVSTEFQNVVAQRKEAAARGGKTSFGRPMPQDEKAS